MKFLVLALCVFAANAAVPAYRSNTPWQFSKAVAQAILPVRENVVQIPVSTVAATKNLVKNTEETAGILASSSEISPEGFKYQYETENGISASSVGSLKKVGDDQVLVFEGGYRYIAPDGTPIEVRYIADENGFQPASNVLPVGPPVPEAILRAQKYILEHPQPIVL